MSSNAGIEQRETRVIRTRHRLASNEARREWIPRAADSGVVAASSQLPTSGSNSEPQSRSQTNTRERVDDRVRSGTRSSNSDNGRRRSHARRVSKDANLPQLVHEIQEKLASGGVECMICCDKVTRAAAIWSCRSCFSIFHLHCVKKWAKAPASADTSVEKNQGLNWRCPGCQSVQLTAAKEIRYLCFCGKRRDPPSDLYLTPHSCGEPCGKPLGSDEDELCPHVCVLQCHPGPCPPCKQFAPAQTCPCGKKPIIMRCSDRRSALTCGQRCEKLLDCGRHHCEQICHVGPCDQCEVTLNASCFCKRTSEVVVCGDVAVKGEVKAEDGIFSCDSFCGKKLDCGNHFCGEICHPGDCGECNLLASKIKSCHCGKTVLTEKRESCLDPIPTCSQKCRKLLPCGKHYCEETCHDGECRPCLVKVPQKCRCASTSRSIECYKTTSDEKFTCDRHCGQKKTCGRHRCNERCCSGEWDSHVCSIPCGKKLRCGQHSCASLCHSGHCPPCLDTIFSDLTCACGRTSNPPPLPCGTPPPSCNLPCLVVATCGHSGSHDCHFGDCPPCSVPVAKECVGGHVVLRNIPCGSKDITCNKLCGKTRQCGMHACGRTCHVSPCDGPTQSQPGSRSSCGQTCGAPRKNCRHTCTAPCHPSSPCPEVRCESPVKIACSCGRLTAIISCDDGSYNQRKLECDDECAKLERKRVLADAFDIAPPSSDTLQFGENSVVSDLYRRDAKWVLSVEERCKYLVVGKSKGTTNGLKTHVFSPMLKDKRDAVRAIADRWKLSINETGFVVVHVTPKSKAPPRILGVKGGIVNASHPPAFDPLVDMDPGLVVSFADLPRDADISSLVLRFGGECELVWLNDRNALAVFHDAARAAAARRRLDHGSVYHGAVVVAHPVGGAGVGASRGAPWSKATAPGESWASEEWRSGDVAWKEEAPIAPSVNRWTVLEAASSSLSKPEAEVADDWEKAFDDAS